MPWRTAHTATAEGFAHNHNDSLGLESPMMYRERAGQPISVNCPQARPQDCRNEASGNALAPVALQEEVVNLVNKTKQYKWLLLSSKTASLMKYKWFFSLGVKNNNVDIVNFG